jgi:hypothetical protein
MKELAIKEELTFFRLILTITTAVNVSLVAWITNNYNTGNTTILTTASILAIITVIILSYSLVKIILKIKQINKL